VPAKLKIAIAADHGGYDMKEAIKEATAHRYMWLDMGTHSNSSVNYAEFGHAMGKAITEGEADRGVIICGTGIGISIAANRYPAVRAGLCTDATMARLTRAHNDANVLALGARIIGMEVALDCLEVFMNTEFEGGRHEERIALLASTL
jgi:ribose 5-phosphate isomerase B